MTVKKPDTILDEIHATRRKIEEQTKNMTSSERTEYFNKAGATAARKYGFRRVAKPKQKVLLND